MLSGGMLGFSAGATARHGRRIESLAWARRIANGVDDKDLELLIWCGRRDSNPHDVAIEGF
jgi:hypothetical protein